MPAAALARVLTVEDDPIVRADLRLILNEAGYDVCDARDGVEAVEFARAHRPDLILIDLGLPRVDGVEATRQILQERDVPIVALTGHTNGPMIERALEAGAVGHVEKPFHEAALLSVIAGALSEHSSRESSADTPPGAVVTPAGGRKRWWELDLGAWDDELGMPSGLASFFSVLSGRDRR